MGRKANIIILVFFHLLVFVAPITIKTGHHHAPDQGITSFPDNRPAISQAEKLCLICSFELVPVITQEYHSYTVDLQVSKFYLARPLEAIFRKPFTYFLLRAPPFLI
jgi:hypothetical protein